MKKTADRYVVEYREARGVVTVSRRQKIPFPACTITEFIPFRSEPARERESSIMLLRTYHITALDRRYRVRFFFFGEGPARWRRGGIPTTST